MTTHVNPPSLHVNFTASGGGEVMPSVSIEKIIACRQQALTCVSDALLLIEEAGRHSQAAGGKAIFNLDGYHRGDLFSGTREEILTRITRRNDRHIWQDLMNQSGMLTLMDEQAKTEWSSNLEAGKYPEVTHANIIASFTQLNAEKRAVFERGVINVFRSLSWNYKTNQPHMFGRKVILNNIVGYNEWGFHTDRHNQAKLDDLERVLSLLDGKTLPDHRTGVLNQFQNHVSHFRKTSADFDSEYFTLRYFKKGSGHLTFRRSDLTEKLNEILSRHFPDALPPARS